MENLEGTCGASLGWGRAEGQKKKEEKGKEKKGKEKLKKKEFFGGGKRNATTYILRQACSGRLLRRGCASSTMGLGAQVARLITAAAALAVLWLLLTGDKSARRELGVRTKIQIR